VPGEEVPQGDREDLSYQRAFFPLVSYKQVLLAGLVGGLVGAAYALLGGSHDYFDAFVGGGLIAQLALGAFAAFRARARRGSGLSRPR
jgi:hypothetical protein